MGFSRRRFFHAAGLAALSGTLGACASTRPPVPSPGVPPPVIPPTPDPVPAAPSPAAPAPGVAAAVPAVVKPPRLRAGDLVGLVSPAGAVSDRGALDVAREAIAALGLRVKVGVHALDRYGYLGGTDHARADDLHGMFDDDDVRAIFTTRGGWGAARLLPLLDYDLIRQHPKVVMGYSDITSLLLALYARTGLVTFHGPVGISTWNAYSVDYVRRVLFDGEAVRLVNPVVPADGPALVADGVETITAGRARGRLAGGNLSVLTALLGSPYVPDWQGHILFVEEIGEEIYRIDRMLTHLQLAGVLERLAGFVFGQCTDCDAEGDHSLALDEVLADHVGRLGIPAWYGSMIGHIARKFTVPVGVEAEIDASRGAIKLLESAVA